MIEGMNQEELVETLMDRAKGYGLVLELISAMGRMEATPSALFHAVGIAGAIMLRFTDTSPGEMVDAMLEAASDDNRMATLAKRLAEAGFTDLDVENPTRDPSTGPTGQPS